MIFCHPNYMLSIFYSNGLIIRMATKQTSESVDKDSFLSEVETARGRLRELVSVIRVSIQRREEELSAELDRLEREHRVRASEYRDRRTSLAAIQAGIEEQFKGGEFEDLKKSVLSETDRKLEALEREYPYRSVEFVCEEGIVERVKGMGEVVVAVGESIRRGEIREAERESEREVGTDRKGSSKELNVEVEIAELAEECIEKPLPIPGTDGGAVDYTTRTKPVTTFGYPQIQCRYPQGIAYRPKENAVYFVGNGSSLFKILLSRNNVSYCALPEIGLSNKYYRGRTLSFPIQANGIALLGSNIYVSGTVLNTDSQSLVNIISSFEVYFSSSTSEMSAKSYKISFRKQVLGEEHNSTGIAVDSELVYVCDYKNNQIQLFSYQITPSTFYYVRTITDPDLYLPLDVKLHEKRIFVLNSRPPYVLEFDLTGFRRDAFFSHSIPPDFLPSFLCIDRAGRFLVSDRRQPYVYVLRRGRSMRAAVQARLELKHGEDPLVEPRGVCLDGEGRVLVLCSYQQATLQIF